MTKQTTVYLTEKDLKRIEKVKETLEISSTSDTIRQLIKEEYERIQKYSNAIV